MKIAFYTSIVLLLLTYLFQLCVIVAAAHMEVPVWVPLVGIVITMACSAVCRITEPYVK